MKRTKFVAGLLALGMVLMGTGYAAWTDTLKVEMKASTGDLEVKFVDMVPYGEYEASTETWAFFDGIKGTKLTPQGRANLPAEGDKTVADGIYNQVNGTGYNDLRNTELNDAIVKEHLSLAGGVIGRGAKEQVNYLKEVDDVANHGTYNQEKLMVSDTLTLEGRNMYPGYAIRYEGDIINTGTIGAKLSKILVSTNIGEYTDETQQEAIKNMIGINLDVATEVGDTSSPGIIQRLIDTKKLDEKKHVFEVGKVRFVSIAGLESVGANTKEGLVVEPETKYVIKVNDKDASRLDIYGGIAMREDFKGEWTTGKADAVLNKTSTGTDSHTQLLKDIKIDVNLIWDQFNTDMGSATNN